VESLGLVRLVAAQLQGAGMEVSVFAEVEPNPSLQTVRRGGQVALGVQPDWIVGLGGGSCLDAAKSVWIQYERPDLTPDDVAPVGKLGLRQKARLVAVPTTSGTGAEVTWPIVLTDTKEHRKITVGHPENIPDLAIIDPCFVRLLPNRITADTGMDALTHAVEGYTSTWHNDFADGLCLRAIQLVFDNLACSCQDGNDEARERMHNAATIAGLGFGNSIAALAHGLGHSLGALLPIPHGRAVGLCLPYTIEYAVRGDVPTRYAGIASLLGLPHAGEAQAAASLASAIRTLAGSIGQPASLRDDGISPDLFAARLDQLVANTAADGATCMGTRIPDEEEIERLLRCVFEGQPIDF
jgi:alcohol dehydrogenase class IV